jgi:hypothetical protein
MCESLPGLCHVNLWSLRNVWIVVNIVGERQQRVCFLLGYRPWKYSSRNVDTISIFVVSVVQQSARQ